MRSNKEMLLNVDLHEDSESQQDKQKVYQDKSKQKASVKVTKASKFDSNAIQRGIFVQQEEGDYHAAVVVPCLLPTNQPPKQLQTLQIEDLLKLPSIQFLQEIVYDSQDEDKMPVQAKQPNFQQQNKENTHQQAKKECEQQQITIAGLSSPVKQSLMNFQLDSSSEQEQKQSDSQSDSPQELKRLLALKFNQLKAVTFPEIATTHNPQQNMKIYTNKAVELGKILHTDIYRDQSFLSALWPEFNLCFAGARMLYAKKMFGSTTSNYYVTLENGIEDTNHELFAAKLRGNHKGNVYQVFTRGANPKKANKNQKKRELEATIIFYPQKQTCEPRQFEVYAMALEHKYQDLDGIYIGQQIGLDVLYQREQNKGKIFRFRNRRPIYSEAIKGYILNFGGRVQKASVKNFILEDTIAHREVLMMGKKEEDCFKVDIQWPLKPLVAFCICLANFDSKFTSD